MALLSVVFVGHLALWYNAAIDTGRANGGLSCVDGDALPGQGVVRSGVVQDTKPKGTKGTKGGLTQGKSPALAPEELKWRVIRRMHGDLALGRDKKARAGE